VNSRLNDAQTRRLDSSHALSESPNFRGFPRRVRQTSCTADVVGKRSQAVVSRSNVVRLTTSV